MILYRFRYFLRYPSPYTVPMKKVLLRLRSYYENEATSTEKSVLQVILQNPREASVMDIRRLSAAGHCSPSTVLRICRKNGFSGYRELRDSLLQEIGFRQSAASNLKPPRAATMSRQLLLQAIRALEQTYELFDQTIMERVVNHLHKASMIHLYGLGASYLVMEDLQMKLVRIGYRCSLLHDLHLQMVDASNAQPGEVAVVASYSGQTEEMIALAKRLKEQGCVVVVITRYAHNELAGQADYCLHVPVTEKKLRTSASSSHITMLYIVEMLYQLLLEKDYDQDMDRIIETGALLEKKKIESDMEEDLSAD
ncbi:MurR/RpiR family transcriptional regulator [uncultured Faecalibaculum sp.]|uniref:MurR/RpiR family transcriptional regulator n=4 Tax=uncultured Faecalibaculum sp. TaxID=1729681 RepID=UPI0035180C9C